MEKNRIGLALGLGRVESEKGIGHSLTNSAPDVDK